MATGRHVIITGGLGFVGQELCKALLKAGSLGGDSVTKILLVDIVDPQPRPHCCSDPRVAVQIGNMAESAACKELLTFGGGGRLSIFHLAGIMSGQGEKDFDLCLSANLDATRNLLQAARMARAESEEKVRFVFSSTGAAFGETAECPVSDTTKLVPLNTYGMTKAVCELLVNDFSRKGFVDGRSARLPTVIVRPGKPNAATTSCFSGVVREPLHGVDCQLPVGRQLPHAVTSTRAVVGGLQALHDVQWPKGLVDRAVTLPSISITIQQIIDAMHRVVPAADHGKLGKIVDQEDAFLNKVVSEMACRKMSNSRALQLGLPLPGDLDAIIHEFIDDFGEGVVFTMLQSPSAKRPRTQQDAARRVAVVTGGGTGVGKAAALALVTKAGFDALILVGRRAGPLEGTRKAAADAAPNAKILCLTCDVSKSHEVSKLFAEIEAEFGRCDLLFNNAGANAPAVPMEELPVDDWNRVIDTNVSGVFFCTRESFALMKRQKPQGGRIINNGSISADRPRPMSAAYTASKHAVSGLTKTTALDGRPFGIACGQLNIGNALTDMSARLAEGALQPSGQKIPEPMMEVVNVGDAIAFMAALPPGANTLELTIMATTMPLVGRG